MLDKIAPWLPSADELVGRYVEPFVGGASVFFFMSPRKAELADNNAELMELYAAISDDPDKVWGYYRSFPVGKKAYLGIRSSLSLEASIHHRAARTLYLNRTCFKGMWRHNRKGDFNVGYGGESRRWAIGYEHLLAVSLRLSNATLSCVDFEDTLEKTTEGDFVYIDPPYSPGMPSTSESTQHYLGFDFDFPEQQRLQQSLERATQRGVRWVMTNSSHPQILALYENSDIHRIRNSPTRGRTRGEAVITSGEHHRDA